MYLLKIKNFQRKESLHVYSFIDGQTNSPIMDSLSNKHIHKQKVPYASVTQK